MGKAERRRRRRFRFNNTKGLMCMRYKSQVVFLSIKHFEFKTDFLFLKNIFACRVVAAKFQSILDNFYNILTTVKIVQIMQLVCNI